MPAGTTSTSLSITNPLVLYRTLVATNQIKADPAQHRLALQLQKLYFRLKDYQPELEYRHRLDQISRSLPDLHHVSQQRLGPPPPPPTPGFLSNLFRGSDAKPTLSLTRSVPIHDSALSIDSPQGMLLYGEVGRGKSMLLDLLYSALPSRQKRRWHFSTFMLDIFRRLERSRVERAALRQNLEHEHVILTLAKDTVATSPILFLDEFQMPDRAASKLLNGFMTSFFHLGGVLVASSNRMPDELAKASGLEFSRAPARSAFGWRSQKFSEGEKGAQSDFGMFLEVLKARCEVWEMEGERDWRRDTGEDIASEDVVEALGIDKDTQDGPSVAGDSALLIDTDSKNTSSDSPPYYHLTFSPSTFTTAVTHLNPTATWSPTTLHIYSRPLHFPHTHSGVALCTFSELCATNLGPADYTSLCSHFHTLILTDVPVLTLLLKNEARRFITLLDALYECRCRLLIQADAPPDRLFFPETRIRSTTATAMNSISDTSDPISSEAYSEIYQDSTAPFRPNISSYTPQSDTSATPTLSPQSNLRTVLADEDADFGPTYGNGRGHGMSNDRSRSNDHNLSASNPKDPDFTNLSALTGQDETFAYKRARSRLWELCSQRYWSARPTPDPTSNEDLSPSWHTPVHLEGRFWEAMPSHRLPSSASGSVTLSGEDLGSMEGTHDGSRSKADDLYRDTERLFRHGGSPYRVSEEKPPSFGWWHAWGLGTWGKRGSGDAKALRERRKAREGDGEGDGEKRNRS